MITGVDTNILIDILIPNTPHGEWSQQALAEALRAGALIVSEPVYAELAARFPNQDDLDRFLADTGMRLQPSGADVLYLAGRTWRAYRDRQSGLVTCPQCGHTQTAQCRQCGRALTLRQHIVADFLIGAHAFVLADRLLTRDRGYYRTYFPQLALLSP